MENKKTEEIRNGWISNKKENILMFKKYNDIKYSIGFDKLDKIRENHIVNGGFTLPNVSEWIAQLFHKTFIDIEDLYELASIIQYCCPKNKINWVNTFYLIKIETELKLIYNVLTEINFFDGSFNPSCSFCSSVELVKNRKIFSEVAEKHLLKYKYIIF